MELPRLNLSLHVMCTFQQQNISHSAVVTPAAEIESCTFGHSMGGAYTPHNQSVNIINTLNLPGSFCLMVLLSRKKPQAPKQASTCQPQVVSVSYTCQLMYGIHTSTLGRAKCGRQHKRYKTSLLGPERTTNIRVDD